MPDITVTTLDGGKTDLDEGTIDAFAGGLKGGLLFPGDEGFDDATLLWNGMIDKRPAVVVQPRATADVQATVDFAREHGLLLGIRGGGHNIAGTALADGGINLDMSNLQDVTVDVEDRTVTAGAGCLLKHVDQATQEHGLATPLGFVSDTGLAGLTLGGGFGYLTRRFGWTVDNLEAVEMVTADGEVRTASADENEDLFWAVRGAGQNMGVVTSFTFRLHEVGPEVTGGLIGFPAEDEEQARKALEVYREITADAPRNLTVFMLMRRAPPAPFIPEEWHGRRVAVFAICHSGTAEEAEQDLALLTDRLGEPPVDIVARRPYTELQSLIDQTQPKGEHYYWKTEFTTELSDELFDVWVDLSFDNPIPKGQLVFAHLGGALNERDDDDGAVGNRDVQFVYGMAGMWAPGEPKADEYRQWVRDAWDRFRPFSTGRTYVNFQTADDTVERTEATYRENLDRLREVKAKYDPDNLFRVNRNVAPNA